MRARWWILLVVLAMTFVVAWLLWRGPGETPMSREEAAERLMVLGERFDQAIQNGRERADLLPATEAVVERWPDLPEGHRLLGQMYADAGEDASAYASFRRALELSTEPDGSLESLTAAVAERAGRLDEAFQRYQRARELEPIKTAHRVRIANVLLKLGRLDEARSVAEQVVQEDGSEHEAHAVLALVARERGDQDEELARWESAWLASPRDEKGVQQRRDYAQRLARRLIELGRPDEAARTLRMLDEEAFFEAGVLATNAEALEASGLTFEAGRYYENWWTREPLNATAAAEAARWYLKADAPDQARRMLNELRKIDAGDARLIELEQRMRERLSPR